MYIYFLQKHQVNAMGKENLFNMYPRKKWINIWEEWTLITTSHSHKTEFKMDDGPKPKSLEISSLS